MSDYQPIPQWDKHADFLQKVVDILFKNVVFATNQDKVVLYKAPQDLEEIFDFSLSQYGESQDKLLMFLKKTIKYSVKTGHPYFINQLFSGLDPYGLAGQWLTDALNASMYTYEVAPVFTLMEQHIIKEICGMIGPEWGDGMFCPGGSLGNGMGLNLARFKKFPSIKKKGYHNAARMVIFASEECHYSIQKFASFEGIGEENVISVITDEVGRMIIPDLEQKIIHQKELGAVPIAVVCTMGTTVRGAFDPVNEIADICKRHDIWLHVDAAWGGGLIFSQKHRTKLNGIERADSVVINPHKLLAVPQQCSLLLVRDKQILLRCKNGMVERHGVRFLVIQRGYDTSFREAVVVTTLLNGGVNPAQEEILVIFKHLPECHSKGAEYLFQKDKYYDQAYDVGDKYLQCGRKCDVFKFWLMWKAKGSSGFATHIDTLMEVAEHLEEQIQQRPDFMLVSKRHYMNVCFWYLPRYLRGKANILDYSSQLHKVAPLIKGVMVKHGSVMLGYQPIKQFPNCFRFVSQNSALKKKDTTFLLDHIAEIGEAIFK